MLSSCIEDGKTGKMMKQKRESTKTKGICKSHIKIYHIITKVKVNKQICN